MRRLYLNSSQLTTLPDDIGELKELVWLNQAVSFIITHKTSQ